MEDNLIMKKKGESLLATWMKRRVKRNQNVLSVTTGQTGSGKSYVDLSLAREIDLDFDVERQVVFKLSKFMEVLNSEWFKKKKWKVLIYEEAQVSISNRQWQSGMNKMLNYVLSTFRHQNVILFFNAPFRNFLDSQAMRLIHIVIETKKIDRKKNLCFVRPKLLIYYPKSKEPYEYSMYEIGLDKKVRKAMFHTIPKPIKKDCLKYEEIKLAFTTELNKDILKTAQQLEGVGSQIDTRKPLTDQQKLILKTYKKLKKVVDVEEKLGIDKGSVSRQLKVCRMRGYSLENDDFEYN